MAITRIKKIINPFKNSIGLIVITFYNSFRHKLTINDYEKKLFYIFKRKGSIMADFLEYGPIICVEGSHKGRVGYFDDTDIDCGSCSNDCCFRNCNINDCDNCPQNEMKDNECPELAIVYF